MRPRCLAVLCCLDAILLLSLPAAAAEPAKLDAAQVEFFEKRIRPVLIEHCLKCHGEEKQKGGLRLDSHAAMMAGGDSGPAMVVGKPDASRLIQALRHDGRIRMPPAKKLPDEQIDALTSWVKLGAPWPSASATLRVTDPVKGLQITAKDRAFWSFRPVSNPPQPAVKNASWPRSPLDFFVLAKLEEQGLSPAPPAEPRTLLRRIYFDLLGLPPTPDEVEAFAKAAARNPQAAIAEVVERLLASPHYGERWARHWLDIARYGEDQAHTFSARLYPHGFRYRDWVVRAFNSDLPYDRFLMEQIAGDLLDGDPLSSPSSQGGATSPIPPLAGRGEEGSSRADRLAALGYFALGPAYYGKATAEELDDRIDTLCRGMLGLTVACARCHDHKYDPIPTRDYYSLAGIFASTQYKEYPLADPKTAAEYERVQAEIKNQTDAVNAFLRKEATRMSEALSGELGRYVLAAWKLHEQRKTTPALAVADSAKREKLHDFVLERWLSYLFPQGTDERPHLAGWREVLKRQDAARDHSADAGAVAAVQQAAADFQETILAVQKKPDAAADALYKEVVLGVQNIPRERVEKLLIAEVQKQLSSQRAAVESLKKTLPKLPIIHALMESPSPANMRVYIRGNPATPGDEAPRRFLGILAGDSPPLFTEGSGRLELARAIASKDNPLTARVMVNRIWLHHFGKGLVATPSNFGQLGERPTHPELLDYLAAQFMAGAGSGGWSIKALHRTILLSATYQQAATNPQATSRNPQAIDPANKLYWRMDRRRLEVEAWRDALLAVAGNLDRTVGGPSADLAAPEQRRRTLYAAVSRHNLDGLLRLFDFPDPNVTSEKRPITTVALQQLFVLNSEFMIRQAKALAARLVANEDDNSARIRRAFVLVYGRPVQEEELRLGLEFLNAATAQTKLSAWEQYAQVLLAANEFAFVD